MDVRNINFQGSGRLSNGGDGIAFEMDLPRGQKLPRVVLEGIDVWGFGYRGIRFESKDASKSGYRWVVVRDARSHDNGEAGMLSRGKFSSSATGWSHKDFLVSRCKFFNNPGRAEYTNTHSGSGIYLADVDGAKVEYCEAHNNGWLCNHAGGGPVGIWAWDANRVTIQFNESHHNKTGSVSTDGGGFDLDGGVTGSVVQYNYSHDNHGAGYLLAQFRNARPFGGNTVRYNVSQNDSRGNRGQGAINLWDDQGDDEPLKDCEIYNNTVFISPAPAQPSALRLMTCVQNVRVRNNLFVTTGGVPLVNVVCGGARFEGNNYFSSGGAFVIRWRGTTYSSLAAWRSGSGQETLWGSPVGSALDPMLVAPGTGGNLWDSGSLNAISGYRLQRGSPMIDAALDLQALFGTDSGTRDLWGTALPLGAAYDIGANEVR